jgi:hypothetical protein
MSTSKSAARAPHAGRRPDLEFGIAGGRQTNPQPAPAPAHRQVPHDLGVTAVEPFGRADHGAENPDRPPVGGREGCELRVRLLREGLAMVAGNERDPLHFVRFEPAQAPVTDEVVRVLVVAFVADVRADVVEQRAVLEPFPLPRPQTVSRTRRIEEGQ